MTHLLGRRAGRGNSRGASLPLLDAADLRRWRLAPPAARMLRRRFGLSLPLALVVAEAAGFQGGDR